MDIVEKTPLGALTTAKVVRAATAFNGVAEILKADTVELANGGRGGGEVGGFRSGVWYGAPLLLTK